MLEITVGGTEFYDEETSAFLIRDGYDLQLEHSLVSLSKWESKFEKPFLDTKEKAPEELFEYVKMMTLTPDVPDEVFENLSEKNIVAINDYMSATMTATWFSEPPGAPKSREIATAEVIYYWMTAFNIPFECQHWHLNRLLTLIRVCNLKQAKPQKMSRAEAASRQRELNEMRKRQYQTKG